jgi:hypothetical protein
MSRLFSNSFPSECFRRAATGKAILAILAVFWGIVPVSAADKTITVEPLNRMDAVRITRVTLGGADVQCGLILSPTEVQPVTPVAASDDWLQNITIELLNRTDKNIVHGEITLDFPEKGAGTRDSPRTVYVTGFGRYPAGVVTINGITRQPMVPRNDPDTKPVLLAPGQTMVFSVREYIEEIKRVVDPKAISKVIIRRSSVLFDDAMRWDSGGGYSNPDPEHPGKWRYLDPSYFPGTPDWPPRAHK